MENEEWPGLVPELTVSDLDQSLAFYVELADFTVVDRRGDPPFAVVRCGRNLIMLEELHDGSWLTDTLEKPFGRGVNFEMECDEPEALARRMHAAGVTLFREYRVSTYLSGGLPVSQAEFLVADPDGYLLRFVRELDIVR